MKSEEEMPSLKPSVPDNVPGMEAEEREKRDLATAVEHSPLSVIITDTDGIIEYANPRCTALSGYLQEELVGANVRLFKSGLTPRETYDAMWSTIRAGREWRGELRNRKKDGSLSWEELVIAPVADEAGKPIRFVGLKTDITERKEALDKLIQSEERYRMLFESAPVGIMYCSHDGSLLDFNAALTAVFETLESQSREKINVFDFSPFAHAGIAEACREAITGDHSVYREHEYRPLPARPLILRFVVTPTHDLSGRVNGAHTLIEDFTERRNAEIRLSRSLTEKETLLKEIHHRVKNNLQTVSSLLTLQAEKVEEDRARSALLDSVTRVNSMSMIHERLYGATDLREVRFDEYLAELVEHLLTLGVPTPLEPEVELEVAACLLDIDTAVPLSLVANELISNALKHAFAAVEEPRLIIRLSASAETVQLVIGDNGPGVPTSDGSAPPAGLGLQLVDVLVKQVRGTLTRESTAGHTVMVTVPLPPGREQEATPEE